MREDSAAFSGMNVVSDNGYMRFHPGNKEINLNNMGYRVSVEVYNILYRFEQVLVSDTLIIY